MFDNTIQGIGGVSGGAYGNYGGYAQYANAGAAAGQQAQGQGQGQPPEKPNFQELVQNISSMLQQGMDVNSIAQQLEASMPKPPQDKVQFSNEGQNFAASQNETQQLQALKQNYAL